MLSDPLQIKVGKKGIFLLVSMRYFTSVAGANMAVIVKKLVIVVLIKALV